MRQRDRYCGLRSLGTQEGMERWSLSRSGVRPDSTRSETRTCNKLRLSSHVLSLQDPSLSVPSTRPSCLVEARLVLVLPIVVVGLAAVAVDQELVVAGQQPPLVVVEQSCIRRLPLPLTVKDSEEERTVPKSVLVQLHREQRLRACRGSLVSGYMDYPQSLQTHKGDVCTANQAVLHNTRHQAEVAAVDMVAPAPANASEATRPDRKGKNHHPGVNAKLRKRTREEIQEEAERTRALKRAETEKHERERQEQVDKEATGAKKIAQMMDQHAEEDVEDEEETVRLEAMASEGVEGDARAIDGDGDAAMTDGVSHMLTVYFFHRQPCLSQVSKKTQREKRDERASAVIAAIDEHRLSGSLSHKTLPSKKALYDAFSMAHRI